MHALLGVLYHIGVGSSVVCSTISGNAKASVRGTDDRQFHAFFCYRSSLGPRTHENFMKGILIFQVSDKFFLSSIQEIYGCPQNWGGDYSLKYERRRRHQHYLYHTCN